jgi:hypothetical protein
MVARALTWRGTMRLNQNLTRRNVLAEDKLFKAEYVGSGTFLISKPTRKKAKVRQTSLKNPRRGSRK